jgi:DNA-binding response OmpR family regulator
MENKMVVIIDSDESVLELFSLILQEAGYDVMAILNAVPYPFSSSQADLFLMDISLDNPTTKEFYQIMKSDPTTASIPIIVTSTSTDLEQKAAALKVQGYISKPFDIEDLLRKVGELVDL